MASAALWQNESRSGAGVSKLEDRRRITNHESRSGSGVSRLEGRSANNESRITDFVAGAALCEVSSADFVAGAALG